MIVLFLTSSTTCGSIDLMRFSTPGSVTRLSPVLDDEKKSLSVVEILNSRSPDILDLYHPSYTGDVLYIG